jgi:uncharacterized protein YbcI
MATQLGESTRSITEDETRDRDEAPEARHVREKGRAERILSRDISRAMVNLLKDHVGRGPSYAQAYIHKDLVVVVLRRTMTKAERTLAAEGEEAMVRGVRQVLHAKFREDANGIVERLTGQRVSAFLTDHDVDEDVAIQAFVLEPGPIRPVSQGPVDGHMSGPRS